MHRPIIDHTMTDELRSPERDRTRRTREHARHSGPPTNAGRLRHLAAGGTEGNERLTILAGLLLIVLFAALGITILRIGQLLWWHLFLGLLLLGPVALKMASAGYRFMRYYTRNKRYRVKGPPAPALRILALAVVGLTVLVFASGVVLLFIGPGSSLRSDVFLVHKATFILWIGAIAIHILGHLPEIARFLRISGNTRMGISAAYSPPPRGSAPHVQPSAVERLPGGAGRWLSLGTVVVLGLVLAVALIPQFGSWTSPAAAALLHHHHFR
jgi:hypothetical protein